MLLDSNLQHLEALKTEVVAVSGLKSISSRDCRTVSFLIITKTRLSVSETTIKRVFGFAVSRFNPSAYTLDALSVYCGYENWKAFCNSRLPAAPSDGKYPFDHHSQSIGTAEQRVPVTTLFEDPIVVALLESSLSTLIIKANAPEFTIIAFNEAYRDMSFTQNRDIKGMSVWEAFDPHLAGSNGPTLLLQALHNAIDKQQTIQMEPLHYNVLSEVRHIVALSWWDFKIVPLVYDGVVTHLMLNVTNITNLVLHQDEIEKAIIKELTEAEDLATTNVKLNQSNEILADHFEQLNKVKSELEELNRSLEMRVFLRTRLLSESESKQRKLIDNAPVAIAVLKGPDHVIETANKNIIKYWGKTESVINKPLAVALPELEGQPFISILNEVRATGVSYINPELRAYLNFNGVHQPRYFNMIYQPIQHVQGITDSIFIVAFDITDHVMARQKLQQSESMLRLAVTAANIGTWSFDLKSKEIIYNHIFATLLGWEKEEQMNIDQALNQVTDEYRDEIVNVIAYAIVNDTDYEFSYSHRRFNDNQVIHLKALGKTSLDDAGTKIFSGVIWETKGAIA